MKNPFKSDDDEEGRPDETGTDEKGKGPDYKDDPSLLGASSDYAQRGTTGQYAGGGPGDESGNYASNREVRGAHSGSQEQWRGPSAQSAAAEPATPEAKEGSEAYGDVPSRSADPGQSSYGGFKNEGPSSNDATQQKASDDGKPASTDGTGSSK